MRLFFGLILCWCHLSVAQPTQWMFPDVHHGAIVSVDYSKNNQFLLTGSVDRRAMLWNVEKRILIRAFNGHLDGLTGSSFAMSDSFVITASYDGNLIIWRTNTGEKIKVIAAYTGIVIADKLGERNPLKTPFSLDAQGRKLFFYQKQVNRFTLVCYDLKTLNQLWAIPVSAPASKPGDFSCSDDGDWVVLTDYAINSTTRESMPYLRLIYTNDTALQYRWWGTEAVFEGNELLMSNGYSLARFNPKYETSALLTVPGGYGYFKQLLGNDKCLMECFQEKDNGNYMVRNFNLNKPFKNIPDSVSYYLSGSWEYRLPEWRMVDLKTQKLNSIVIAGDSGSKWQPVHRINSVLAKQGMLAFESKKDGIAFYHIGSGKSVFLEPLRNIDIKIVSPSLKRQDAFLISYESVDGFEFGEITFDFVDGTWKFDKFHLNLLHNNSLSVEDDDGVLTNLLLLPSGSKAIASVNNKIMITDYVTGEVKQLPVPTSELSIRKLGLAAVNNTGTRFRCFTEKNNIYTFSIKNGEPVTGAKNVKNEKWRLLPDQTLFGTELVSVSADSQWVVSLKKGKIRINNRKKDFIEMLVDAGTPGYADFQVVNDRYLFAMGNDGGLRVFTLDDGGLLLTQWMFSNGGLFTVSEDGRYDANAQALRLLYGVNKNEIKPFSDAGLQFTPGLRKLIIRQ